MKRRFILLKDTPELKKGAILEEDCDNGDQGFTVIGTEWNRYDDENYAVGYSRKTVICQPSWFEELGWLNIRKSQLDKVKTFLENLGKAKPKAKKKVVIKKKK